MRNHDFHPCRLDNFAAVVLALVMSSSCAAESDTKPLDLSIPKDVLTGSKRQTTPELIPLLNSGYKEMPRSPAFSLYVEHAKEKIRRTLNSTPPHDKFGRSVCGEIGYRATIRPDGMLDQVEIIPVSGTTNDDRMEIFSAAVNQAIQSAAPFASFPKEFGVSNGLVLISGGFGRECRVWVRSTSQPGKRPKTIFE